MKLKKPKKSKAKAVETDENGEVAGKKKGGKKVLLLIPVALVAVAAVAAAVIFLVLPRFGINLLGGPAEEDPLEEPLPKNGIDVYEIGADSVPALGTVLEEGEGELVMLRKPSAFFDDESGELSDRYTYIYELTSFASVMDRYLDVVTSSEHGFYITDENYLVQEERPELHDEAGALVLARNAAVAEGEEPGEARVFQLVIGWSEASANLAVRVSTAPGKISFPKKEESGGASAAEPSSVSLQMEQLRNMSPAHLGLPGESMDQYTIFPVDGFVKVNEQDCRRFNIYDSRNPGSIAGTYFFSVDQQHIYVLNPSDNSVHTIK